MALDAKCMKCDHVESDHVVAGLCRDGCKCERFRVPGSPEVIDIGPDDLLVLQAEYRLSKEQCDSLIEEWVKGTTSRRIVLMHSGLRPVVLRDYYKHHPRPVVEGS